MDLYIDGHNVNKLEDIIYLLVSIQSNVWGTKLKFYVDIGHDMRSESVITDEGGAAINFQSEVDIMNYLYHTGWIHRESLYHTSPNGKKSIRITFIRKGA